MIKKLFLLISILFVALLIWLTTLYSQIRFDIDKIVNYKPKLTTQFFDRNNKHISNIFDNEHRLYVKYKNIPPNIIESLVAIEDTNFFEHSGVNIDAIIRAIIKDIKATTIIGTTRAVFVLVALVTACAARGDVFFILFKNFCYIMFVLLC